MMYHNCDPSCCFELYVEKNHQLIPVYTYVTYLLLLLPWFICYKIASCWLSLQWHLTLHMSFCLVT